MTNLRKGYFGFVIEKLLGLCIRGFVVCEKCLDLGIEIKNLVGCQSDFFFFLVEIENFVWLPRKWIIKLYYLLTINEY